MPQSIVKAKVGDDYRVLYWRARDGQILQNKIIVSGRECMAKQRELYAEAK